MDPSTDPAIPDSFHLAASRLIAELEGLRSPAVVVRCLVRAFDRVSASSDLPADDVVLLAETMARGLLTAGIQSRRLAS
jgi:hypothetical protein